MGLSASPGSTTYPVWVPTVMAEQGANGPSYSEGLQMWGALNPHSSPRRAWGTARPWLGVGRVKVGALDSVQKRETAGVRLARGPELAPCSGETTWGFPRPPEHSCQAWCPTLHHDEHFSGPEARDLDLLPAGVVCFHPRSFQTGTSLNPGSSACGIQCVFPPCTPQS